MNFWNIKHTKQRLAILQKSQAQKRHLIGLIKAKSVVAQQTRNCSWASKSPTGSLSRFVRNKNQYSPVNRQITRNNNILVKKIVNAEKLRGEQSLQKTNCKFINITKTLSLNHSNIYHIKKQMKQKQIDMQNTKIFARLIKTSPTIRRTDWMRKNMQTVKYKENLNRSKYAKPDYSVEACKLMRNNSSKNYHLKSLRPNVFTSQGKSRFLNDSPVSQFKMRA